MRLCDLPLFTPVAIECVEDTLEADPIATRMRELGFIRGEIVSIIALGPFGGNPLMVKIGFTRFALRRSEAHRIRVNLLS
jgi:ferrous iron transport protein A